MNLGRWIAMAIVVGVPLLVISDTGRSWIIRGKYSEGVWILLLTAAVLGGVSAFWTLRGPAQIAAAVLVSTPLIQAVAFVLADRLFQVVAGRVPVSFHEARQAPLKDVGVYWADKIFWVAVHFGLIGGGVFLCVSFDIELPS